MTHLYIVPLPELAQSDSRDHLRNQLAEAGLLDDAAVVEQLSSDSAEVTLEGQYRYGDPYSPMVANELEELAESRLEKLPLWHSDGDTDVPKAGYYEVERADVEPAIPASTDIQSYTIDAKHVGTKDSHYRAVRTNPGQVDHDFGNDLVVTIAIPAAARKTQWFHPAERFTEVAAPVDSAETRTGTVDRYDLEDASWYDFPDDGAEAPILLYELEYETEVAAGVFVFDTLGHGEKYDENDVRQWQAVLLPSHDADHSIVISNGLLRLRLDEQAGELTAETWDSVTDTWTETLGAADQPADVSLFDADITQISMASDRAQLLFDVSGELFALNVALQRGHEDTLISLPPDQSGPIPDDLENWLAPIAQTSIVDPVPEKGLVSRSEVRR